MRGRTGGASGRASPHVQFRLPRDVVYETTRAREQRAHLPHRSADRADGPSQERSASGWGSRCNTLPTWLFLPANSERRQLRGAGMSFDPVRQPRITWFERACGATRGAISGHGGSPGSRSVDRDGAVGWRLCAKPAGRTPATRAERAQNNRRTPNVRTPGITKKTVRM